MIPIYFQDKHIVVCEKPAGVASFQTPSGNDMPTLLLQTGIKALSVHRLDTQTSGIMVFALTPKAAADLSRQIQDGTFTKEYAAVSHGCPTEPQGILEDFLFFDRQKNKSFAVKRERKGVKKAKLSYQIADTLLTQAGQISVWHIRLYTGRTHQIRVQLASRKMPLLGEGKYGAADNLPELHLKSIRLSFKHPETGEKLCFGESDFIPTRLFPDIYTFPRPSL